MILSVEEAERVREQNAVCGFDAYSLTRFEEDLRDLGLLLKTASPLVKQHMHHFLFICVCVCVCVCVSLICPYVSYIA